MRRYRRNSEVSFTVEEIRAMAEGSGLANLAAVLRNDAIAEAFAAKVNALVATISAERAAAAAAEAERVRAAEAERTRAAASRDLTDREGWSMSAALFTAENFPTLSDEERSALRAAFREEAEKAAA